MVHQKKTTTVPVAMTIAGSDSGGGAGIQADLRTFSFHRVHGASALTCVTAQNTTAVTRVDALPPESVIAQIQAIVCDMQVSSCKTGMLLNQPIIEAVARYIKQSPLENLVVDPVMISRAGDKLIDDSAIETLIDQLLPQAKLLTPNRHEAQLLAGMAIDSVGDMKVAVEKIKRMGPEAVLVKGGGLVGPDRGIDVWFDGSNLQTLTTEYVDTPNTHGTGCTLSAAIAANLANGCDMLTACKLAKTYVTNALKHGLSIGTGKGPVGHFFALLRPSGN